MADLGIVTQYPEPWIVSVTDNNVNTQGVGLGVVSLQAIPDTDYGFLAGTVGAQIAAAMGSEYEPPTTTPNPSGSFNTKQVVSIIGQQIAAALNR